jgi:hypothetical protein
MIKIKSSRAVNPGTTNNSPGGNSMVQFIGAEG